MADDQEITLDSPEVADRIKSLKELTPLQSWALGILEHSGKPYPYYRKEGYYDPRIMVYFKTRLDALAFQRALKGRGNVNYYRNQWQWVLGGRKQVMMFAHAFVKLMTPKAQEHWDVLFNPPPPPEVDDLIPQEDEDEEWQDETEEMTDEELEERTLSIFH